MGSFVGIIYSFYLRSIKHPSWLALITRSDERVESHGYGERQQTMHFGRRPSRMQRNPQYSQLSRCGQTATCWMVSIGCKSAFAWPVCQLSLSSRYSTLASRNYHQTAVGRQAGSQSGYISSLRWDNAETFLLHGTRELTRKMLHFGWQITQMKCTKYAPFITCYGHLPAPLPRRRACGLCQLVRVAESG